MNKTDTTELTLDYIKIMGRECFSDYSINLQKQYKALASLGQKDAIVRYLENQIKNNDATILPEVAEIVNNLNVDDSLINAYCKALKSYVENLDNYNNLLFLIKERHSDLLNFVKTKHTIKNAEERYYARNHILVEFDAESKQYLNSEFMQILKLAIEKFSSTLTKQNLKPEIREIAIEPAFFEMQMPTKVFKIDLPELALYTHILEEVDNIPGLTLFKDTSKINKLNKYVLNSITSFNYHTYPTITEKATIMQLVKGKKVKANKVLQQSINKLAEELASLEYSHEFSQLLTNKTKRTIQILETNRTEPTLQN